MLLQHHKKIYFTLLSGLFLYTRVAQQPSSRFFFTSSIGGGGGGEGGGVTCPATQTILYFDASRVSTGDGKSWASAKKTLQEALFIANQCDKVNSIRIAQGVYKPTTGTERNNTFFIGSNFNLVGGYPPGGGITIANNDYNYNIFGEYKGAAYSSIFPSPNLSTAICDAIWLASFLL